MVVVNDTGGVLQSARIDIPFIQTRVSCGDYFGQSLEALAQKDIPSTSLPKKMARVPKRRATSARRRISKIAWMWLVGAAKKEI